VSDESFNQKWERVIKAMPRNRDDLPPADPIAAEARALLPCPSVICGYPEPSPRHYSAGFDVQCPNCGASASTEGYFDTAENAAAAWNQRMKAAGQAAWRPISEATGSGIYLIFRRRSYNGNRKYERRIVASYDGRFWYAYPGCAMIDVPTHFMLLPPPPEGGDS
jgi:hypothetical protein